MTIQIILNGEEKSFDIDTNLQALVDSLALTNKRYAIEVNEDIIPRSEHATFKLSEGDKVEVVQAIGGG